MIVLSAGMPRSGSGWYYKMTNDLLVMAGHDDAQTIRQRFHLHPILKEANCRLAGSRLLHPLLLVPHFSGCTFAVKTHRPPVAKFRLLVSAGIARATYIYRDPRDAALSAFEIGQKQREMARTREFSGLDSMEAAILFIREHLAKWDQWMQYGQMLPVRYENLVAGPVEELRRLARYLGLDVPPRGLKSIAAAYQRPNRAETVYRGKATHFSRGIVGRFREVMTLQELELCRMHLGDYLRKMGYEDE
ncbi:MAG: sulfotransferase domain-containing protein [Planctomycetota bacterium]|jgi:hypothetical protein